MAADEEAGYKIVGEMLGEDVAKGMKAGATSGAFAAMRGDFALRWAFSEVWTRPGLSRRDRSLVTLGMLIALRQTEEIKLHAVAAIRNGCTLKEVEETIYQAIPYAGFPAASSAAVVAAAALKEAGLLDQ